MKIEYKHQGQAYTSSWCGIGTVFGRFWRIGVTGELRTVRIGACTRPPTCTKRGKRFDPSQRRHNAQREFNARTQLQCTCSSHKQLSMWARTLCCWRQSRTQLGGSNELKEWLSKMVRDVCGAWQLNVPIAIAAAADGGGADGHVDGSRVNGAASVA